jgi:hypothetical protein
MTPARVLPGPEQHERRLTCFLQEVRGKQQTDASHSPI